MIYSVGHKYLYLVKGWKSSRKDKLLDQGYIGHIECSHVSDGRKSIQEGCAVQWFFALHQWRGNKQKTKNCVKEASVQGITLDVLPTWGSPPGASLPPCPSLWPSPRSRASPSSRPSVGRSCAWLGQGRSCWLMNISNVSAILTSRWSPVELNILRS